jgi:tetratricopeptide (TPR) repeat protein
MYSHSAKACAFLIAITSCCYCGPLLFAQQPKAAHPSALSPQKAISLAEQGHCRESISGLKHAMAGTVATETRKQAGVLGVRCSLAMDDRDSADEFIRLLNKQFSKDPDVLFVVVHAYSDLSTRTAQELGRTAPDSFAAHKLNAEALEMQGKWQPAQLEYEGMIQKDPNARGIHFLLGRLLLSRPDAGADAAERAAMPVRITFSENSLGETRNATTRFHASRKRPSSIPTSRRPTWGRGFAWLL